MHITLRGENHEITQANKTCAVHLCMINVNKGCFATGEGTTE